MTDVRVQTPATTARTSVPPDEGHIALLAGGSAALLGGAAWALIVGATDTEVGYVAWGVGWFVGFAMVRFTAQRGRILGGLAAVFAAVGLVFGKILILQFISGPAFDRHLQSDPSGMAKAAAWELRQAHSFPAAIQTQIDALGENDTLPDALWEQMMVAGEAEVTRRSPAEQADLGRAYIARVKGNVGFWQQLSWHLSPWDLLWFGLAISTAWSMLARPLGPRAAEATGR